MTGIDIDAGLARRLVNSQFPQWADLPVAPVPAQGWCNGTFRLGSALTIRLPSHEAYAPQTMTEAASLPRLAPHLPVAIPDVVAVGEPAAGFPWRWSVRRWIEGDAVTDAGVQLALDVAAFITALHAIPPDGPAPGPHNFYRGGALATYDAQAREALEALGAEIDAAAATDAWETALATSWDRAPVWIHGDLAQANLLQRDGRLAGVIDF